MKPVHRLFISLTLAVMVGAPPLIAAKPGRAGAETEPDPQRQVTPPDRGGQSERQVPDAAPPERPARREDEPRIAPFCEPVPETFFISSLGSIATDLGTAGYVIDRPGRYVLTSDLDVPDVDFGILVQSGNVVVDLRGHTISGRNGDAVLIRLDDVLSVSLRDGKLDGGAAGVVVIPREDGRRSRYLTLRRLQIKGRGHPSYVPMEIREASHVEIRDVEVRGGATGIQIGGFNNRIVDSHIEATDVGLRLDGMGGGGLRDSVVQAPNGVVIAGGNTWITGNRIVGGPAGVAALTITSGQHFVERNRIEARGAAHALRTVWMTGVITLNDLSGGSESTVVLRGELNRLTGNTLDAVETGVSVGGNGNLIERNRIRGKALQCGISFENSGGHVYRSNVIQGASAPVCGEPNTDGGGTESAGSCQAGSCKEEGLVTSSWDKMGAPLHDDDGWVDRTADRVRPCEPGEVVTFSEPRPGETEYGNAGHLIDAPGYYLLTQDLHLPEGDLGVLITSNDVTLDLAGHTVFAVDGGLGGTILGSENVVIRNGSIEGGSLGLRVYGDPGSAGTGLRLERVQIGSGSSLGYSSLSVTNVRRVEIIDSALGGVDSCCSISGSTTGVIIGSSFGASEQGLSMDGFDDGVVFDNHFHGDRSLDVGSGNLIGRNRMDSLNLTGTDNAVKENVFDGSSFTDYALSMHESADRNLIEDSIISSVRLRSSGNLIVGSIVGRGIVVEGTNNRIKNNLIGGPYCGLDLVSDGAHRYRENVITGTPEGICGFPNEDQGGNVVPPTVCGNLVKAINEVCEAHDTIDSGCLDLGFENGVVVCNETCDGYSTSGCSTCGDGIPQSWESCDDADLRGQTCISRGFEGGTLGCNQDCSFDGTGCVGGCGNGIIEGEEICETNTLLGETCQSQGFQGGVLECKQCTGFIVEKCYGGCGNGIPEAGEQCEPSISYEYCSLLGWVCNCRSFGYQRGPLRCNDDCTWDFSVCTP